MCSWKVRTVFGTAYSTRFGHDAKVSRYFVTSMHGLARPDSNGSLGPAGQQVGFGGIVVQFRGGGAVENWIIEFQKWMCCGMEQLRKVSEVEELQSRAPIGRGGNPRKGDVLRPTTLHTWPDHVPAPGLMS